MSIQQTIIDELNLSDLPKDKQEALLAKMAEIVLKRIFLLVLENLTPEDQDRFTTLIDENPEQAEAFLLEKVPGFNALAETEIEAFRAEMQKETADNMRALENE